MIAICQAGGANLASVTNALDRLGVSHCLTDERKVLKSAEKVILPGVGAAGQGIESLKERNLLTTLRGLTQPVFGICLGMQLLFEHSEEDDTECLGVIKGKVIKFKSGRLPLPHMGWNDLAFDSPEHPLLTGVPKASDVYFVHSFHAVPEDRGSIVASSCYPRPFTALVARGNFYGAQFHPERSGKVGAQILRNFVEL
jgi:imidazole glycerol-phosphate synthase subunit HisH